jgi:hypothetical protein
MGRPSSGRRSASSTPGHPAPHCRRHQGKAATGFQWGRPEPGCSSNTTPRDAGTIDHRRAAYPGRAQESPGGCCGPTGRKLCLPKAGVPLGALRRDFPIRAGSLGPHRAHAQHGACGPGSPRQRAPPPQPSSPPRREGAPRLPPQAWGTLRQRGGSEPLARTTRSAGFQPGHTTGAVPDPVPNPDYHHVGAKVKTPPFARCLRRYRWTNGDKTTDRLTLRPIRHRTKTCDEVVPSCDLVQHGGPRVIRPIVTGPAWPLRVMGLICKGIPVITVCNPALWEYSGDNLGV